MAVTSTDQKQDQLNTVIPSTTHQKRKMASCANKVEMIGKSCEEKDQFEMVVTSITDLKVKIRNEDDKEEEIGKTCDQNDQSEMVATSTTDEEEAGKTRDGQDQIKLVATPTTDKKRKIDNGDKKEEKIGTTCHQCRQKIKGLSAHCTIVKKDKPCPNKFCEKCLRNRYGEQAEEKSALEDWSCPKCRGICNCSVCMKRRGQQPTGILVHTAKAKGCSSVSELLRVQPPETLVLKKCSQVADEGMENNAALKIEPSDGLTSKADNETSVSTDSCLNPHHVPSSALEKKKRKREELNKVEEISMPKGTEVTSVAGINLPPEDVGHALQFLEFCRAFKEVLDLKEGEAVYILLELIRGGNGCRGKQSPVIRFHIVLLSMIQNDFQNKSPALSYKSGKGSWIHALQNCLSRSQNYLERLKLDGLNLEIDEYENFGSSTRLRIINFLCDEALSSVKLRGWIDENISNLKASKERVQAAKQKETRLKQKLQVEVARDIAANDEEKYQSSQGASGDQLSASEHEAVVSELNTKVVKAQAEVLEAQNLATSEEQRCEDAITEPISSDIDGHTFWKLKGYADNSDIFLRDIGAWEGSEYNENWFKLDAEQAKEVEETVQREKKVTRKRFKLI